MRIWSILLITSESQWCIQIRKSLFSYFNYLVSVTAGGPRNPRGHMEPFYGRLRLVRSVLRASKFSVSKLTENAILWVYYTIHFGFSLFFGTFWVLLFNFLLKYFVWLRVTDEGLVPRMRKWSILLITSESKWCIKISRSLFSYFNYLVSDTAGGPRSRRGHM